MAYTFLNVNYSVNRITLIRKQLDTEAADTQTTNRHSSQAALRTNLISAANLLCLD